jgi:hypothetical protein
MRGAQFQKHHHERADNQTPRRVDDDGRPRKLVWGVRYCEPYAVSRLRTENAANRSREDQIPLSRSRPATLPAVRVGPDANVVTAGWHGHDRYPGRRMCSGP